MNEAAVVIPSRMNHSPARIALVGDYHAEYAAPQGIPRSLAIIRDGGQLCEWKWVHSSTLDRVWGGNAGRAGCEAGTIVDTTSSIRVRVSLPSIPP